MNYNYLTSVKDAIIDYTRDEKEYLKGKDKEELFDIFINEDAITGNASGSYWCNTWRAEECLCHNWDILEEALGEFGYEDTDIISKGAEWCDVIIRCYVLAQALNEAWDEIEEQLKEQEEDND